MFGTTCWSVLASKFVFLIIQIEGFKKKNQLLIICEMSAYRYSFDFEKDEPLDGRYEWVKLNP